MDAVYYYDYLTPVGWLCIGCAQNTLVSCSFGKTNDQMKKCETSYHKDVYRQLQEYFAGKRKGFDLNYAFFFKTAFQEKVYRALLTIPYGKTVSYQDIAKQICADKAYRAVGNANNKNPIVIFVPCHRVIGAQGDLVGYAGGLENKEYLLDLEKRNR